VKRSSTPFLAIWGAVLFLALAAAPGCGSSGGPTGDPDASVASCNAYCAAYTAASCPQPLYASLDDCKMAECFHLPQAPAICQTKIKTYYDCAQADPDGGTCANMGCYDEFKAVLSCQ
jgi:hypothetical protein